MQRIMFVIVGLTLMLSACAPAVPTVSPEQVQASAMAAAQTMIALTVAAIPTETPEPPTPLPSPTPLASPTAMVLPTLQNAFTPTTAPSGGGKTDCNHIFDVGASGPTAKLQINNNTKGSVSGSLWNNSQNTFAQCGYITFGPVAKGQSASIDVPLVHTNLGDTCYYAGAWVNDPKKQTRPSGGPFCIDNTMKWVLNISYDKIIITPP